MRRMMLLLVIVLMLGMTCTPVIAQNPVVLDSSSFQWGEPGFRLWWREVTDAFNKENPGIVVRGNDIPYNDYWDQMTVRLQAGNPPDIMVMGGSLHPYIMLGKFEPLEDRLKGTGILERYPATHRKYAERGGHIYQLPHLTLTYGLWYNKTMFEKARIPIPTNPEQVLKAAQALTVKDDKGNVVQYGYSMLTPPAVYEYYEVLSWVEAFGGHFAKDGVVTVNSPAVVQAVKFLKRLYDAGVTPRQTTMEGYRQLFWEERAAMIFDVVGMAGYVKERNPGLLPRIGGMAVPGGKGLVLPFGLTIAKDSKYRDQAWKFLAFAAQPQWQSRMVELSLSAPGLKADIPDHVVKENPWFSNFLRMASEGKPVPPPGLEEHYERFRRAVVDAMAEVLFKNQPVEEALNNAQKTLEAQIRK